MVKQKQHEALDKFGSAAIGELSIPVSDESDATPFHTVTITYCSSYDYGPNTEMDATAYAGNVSRAQSSRPLYTNPISPVRSMRSHPTQSSSPYRYVRDASYAGSSITSRASTLHRNRTYVTTDEPSISTLGDGDDYGDEEGDDNLEIIKLLRKQVETLKSQLISAQEKNQELKLQQRHNMRPAHVRPAHARPK